MKCKGLYTLLGCTWTIDMSHEHHDKRPQCNKARIDILYKSPSKVRAESEQSLSRMDNIV
jgi:hypothetical protein